MYTVELDGSKRFLVISAAQRVTAEQAKLAAQRVRELVHDVVPGFRVLADYRWLDSMDPAAARHIAEIMDAIEEKRAASVTRVIPDPHKDIGLNILSQFHYGPEIEITTFETLADAGCPTCYGPLAAALFPSLIASASVMYFPFFVVP